MKAKSWWWVLLIAPCLGILPSDGVESFPGEPVAGPAADTEPPFLLAAFGSYDSSAVTVVFSEPVGSGADQDTNYVVIRAGVPDVEIRVDSVAVAATADTVTLAVAEPLAEATTYRVYVSHVEDPAGNVIAPNSLATFTTGADLFGPVTEDLTLTREFPGPVYHVVGDLTIGPGVTLAVESGVNVLFRADHDTVGSGDYPGHAEIICEGTLVAVGAPVDRIVFASAAESPGRGDWGQLSFTGSGRGVLQAVDIEHAGTGVRTTSSDTVFLSDAHIGQLGDPAGAGVLARNAVVEITGCEFRDIDGCGADATGGTLIFEHNQLENIKLDGVVRSGGAGTIDRNRFFNVGGYSAGSEAGAGVSVGNGSSTTVRWNRFEGIGHIGIEMAGAAPSPRVILADTVLNVLRHGMYLMSPGPDTLRECEIVNCGQEGVMLQGPPSGAAFVIQNCLMARCGRDGIRVVSSAFGSVTRGVFVEYTTIHEAEGSGIAVYRNSPAPLAWGVENSIIAGSSYYGILGPAAAEPDPSICFNDVWNSGVNDYGEVECDSACVSVNPLFDDPEGDDYHLQFVSPVRLLGRDGTQMGRYGPANDEPIAVRDEGSRPGPGAALLCRPNPFTRGAVLEFTVPGAAPAVLDVFGVDGRLVRRIEGLELRRGFNELGIGREGLSAGIYLVRVAGQGFKVTGKLVIVD